MSEEGERRMKKMSSRKLLNESSGDERGCEGTIERSDGRKAEGRTKKMEENRRLERKTLKPLKSWAKEETGEG